MKNIYGIVLILGLLTPNISLANIPDFPMSFWGDITINEQNAPAGTIVRAYYGNELAGEVTITESGKYGYNNPTRQKLTIKEGSGIITFKFSSPSHNNQETTGNNTITHTNFVSGETLEKNLSFKVTPQSSGGGSSSSGGGGGGGNSSVVKVITETATTTNAIPALSPVAQQEQIQTLLKQVLTELIKRLQQLIAEKIANQTF